MTVFGKTTDTAFVYALCGPPVYIKEMELSLQCLRQWSDGPVVVVTDSRRNQIAIDERLVDIVIDVAVDGLDTFAPCPASHRSEQAVGDHVASMLLKTALPRVLARDTKTRGLWPRTRWCYLDSDVFALSSKVDEVFWAVDGPVAFALDHCTLERFSPFAMRCSCRRRRAERRQRRQQLRQLLLAPSRLVPGGDQLVIRTVRSVRALFEHATALLYGTGGDSTTGKGTGVSCSHLRDALQREFGVDVPNQHAHWNGGVFTFDHRAGDFFERWHECLQVVCQARQWEERDQGALIAAAWSLGLQHEPCLPVEFNFIVTSRHGELCWDEDRAAFIDSHGCQREPVFVHLFSDVGDQSWSLWRAVAAGRERERTASNRTMA